MKARCGAILLAYISTQQSRRVDPGSIEEA
jgi:hypothetical protein